MGPSPKEDGPYKNYGMMIIMACTRYSLVKGERIVRFVLTTQLSAFYRWTLVLSYSPHWTLHRITMTSGVGLNERLPGSSIRSITRQPRQQNRPNGATNLFFEANAATNSH